MVHETFIGRERERRDLAASLEAAVSGRGRLVLLAGEPGIGKTELAGAVARDALARSAEVLWGRCWGDVGAPAYWPWIQVIRAHAHACGPSELARHAGRGASLIAELVPELRDILPDLPHPAHPSDSEEARFRLFDATAVLLKNASASRAMLVILDDVQWADEPSLVLLQFLAQRLQDTHILVLAAYRDVEAKLLPQVARRIGSLVSDARVLPLRGLSTSDVARLIEQSGSRVVSDSILGAIHRATNGNPLFVIELIRLLAAEGELDRLGPSASLPIPDRVREVIRRHASLVSEPCRRMLSAAAVVGRDFGAGVVQEVTDVPSDQLLDLLAEARSAGLVVETAGSPARFSFPHDLVRETFYDELSQGGRLELHKRIAEAIERLDPEHVEAHAAELAHHFFQAVPSGTARQALEYSTRAGDHARRQLAYEEAALHYERALEALAVMDFADDRLRCQLWLSLGLTRWWAGRLEDSRVAYWQAAGVAERFGAAVDLAEAAFGFGRRGAFAFGLGTGDDEEVIRLLEKALRSLGEQDSSLRAMLMARFALSLAFSPERDRGVELAARAVEMARRVGDKRSLHFVLNAATLATWSPDNLEARLEASEEVGRLTTELGADALMGSGYRATYLLEAGHVRAAELEEEKRSIHVQRCRFCNVWAIVQAARRTLLAGRFDEVEGLARKVLAAQEELQNVHAKQIGLAILFRLRHEQGRAEEILESARALAEQFPARSIWRATLAWTYAELGLAEAARREVERLAIRDFAGVPRDAFWLGTMTASSQAVAFLGTQGHAAPLYELLLPFATRHVIVGGVCFGSASRPLGLLATTLSRFGHAARHFEDALEMNSRLSSRPWVAHTQADYARMLLARGEPGDREKAFELCGLASQTARELGMRSLLDRTAALRIFPAVPDRDQPGANARDGRAARVGVFCREGEFWTIAADDAVVRMKDSKGLRYIAVLLGRPGRDVYAGDLITSREAAGDRPADGRDRPPGGALGDSGPLLDATSTQAYRARIEELREELEHAVDINDPGRAAKAQGELDFLARELSNAIGLGGRRRRAGAVSERARLAVTKAIGTALGKLSRAHPGLGRTLAATIRTGTFCSYRPDPDAPVVWKL